MFSLNLNIYRNAHHFTLNNSKKEYKAVMQEQIKKLPVMDKVSITFVLYPKTKRLCDISNVLSIHDKYFCDALVEAGKIPDDNYLHVPSINYRFGEVDSKDPRVEIHIINGEDL